MTIDPSDIDDSLISLNARKVIRRLNEAGTKPTSLVAVSATCCWTTPKTSTSRPTRCPTRSSNSSGTPARSASGSRSSTCAGRRSSRWHAPAAAEPEQADSGLILSDNEYGTLKEDVERRDFTVNALYYDPEANVLHDEVGGLADLKARRRDCWVTRGALPRGSGADAPRHPLRGKTRFRFRPGDRATDSPAGSPDPGNPPARLFEET